MLWRRLSTLPRPVLVAVIAIPILLLVGGSIALLVNRSSQAPSATATANTTASPSDCPSVDASASPSACASPSPSPMASPSPSPTSAAPGGGPVVSCAGSPGAIPATIPAAFPTALAFAPDGRLFWAERTGTVKVWQGGAARTFATVSTATSGERGLLGLALTPSFAQDHYVYAFYSRADDESKQRVVRWTDCGGNSSAPTTIVDNLPAGSDCCHKGGRIAFSPDGFLFVTIGDNHVLSAPQNPGDVRGKVLRYNAGGGPAGMNGTPVYTLGLRNPFGIAFAPDGTMAITNNGPSADPNTDTCGGCGDMFDIVGNAAGVTYQWPTCWGYSHPVNGATCTGLEPNYSTEKSGLFVAPTGLTYANGKWLFCAYSKGTVFQYDGPKNVSATGMGGCGLDVKQAPDGSIYTASPSAITRH